MAPRPKTVVEVALLVLIGISCCQGASLSFSHGVLDAKNGTSVGSYCVIYYPNITTYPQDNLEPVYEPVVDLTMLWDGCSSNPPNRELISGRVVFTSNGNCSVIRKAQSVENLGGKGLIIVTAQVIPLPANESYSIGIPLAVIGQNSKDSILSLGDSVGVFIYAPVDGSHFDYSLLVIWSLAVLTVGIGAYWSGLVRHDLHAQSRLSTGSRHGEPSEDSKVLQEEVSLSVTPKLVAVFVLCMCGMLLLLYFFFSYLVYVIIGLFVLASTTAVYQCLEPIVRRIPIGATKLPRCNLGIVRVHAETRQIVLFVAAVSLGACWVVYRKEKFAWILQDILGFAFSVNMIRQVRLPSLKICTLLLVLLFFYDIFFVFITPLFTKNGQSVMVEVATGGGSGVSGGTGGSAASSSSGEEQLPMVVRVPHLGYDPLSVCWQRYSLLGFGDILVPGMLVGFCHGFDLATQSVFGETRRFVKAYYITTLIAYGLGLLVTFLGLYLMAIAQPALLYLVPFTLVPVFVLGLCRHELRYLWEGDGLTIESTRLTDNGRLEEGGNYQAAEADAVSDQKSDKSPVQDRNGLVSN